MAETDRERLACLAQEREAQRNEAAALARNEGAERRRQEANMDTSDRKRTEELLAYCKETFTGHKLVPTGHDLKVELAGSSKSMGAEGDRIPYVSVYVEHWADETGHFQGHIPVLLARCRGGTYEVMHGDDGRDESNDLEEFKNRLIELVAGMGRDYMGQVFQRVRQRLTR